MAALGPPAGPGVAIKLDSRSRMGEILGAHFISPKSIRSKLMAAITLKGTPVQTVGELPSPGSTAPAFKLVKSDLSEGKLGDYAGKKVLNIFPSIDTPVCAISVRTFNQKAAEHPGVTVLNISADLPFAHKRFCAAEGLKGVESLSSFRSTFANDYGVQMTTGPLVGLCARAVVVLDENNHVLYTELVPDIAQEPNYAAALAVL
jgi:thiol peroxidase